MASCLGLYIENNIIKYAKVSKSNDAIKVESFGIKFYDNIENAINQIVEETYSFKVPISVNMSEEVYNKLEVFNLLSKKDMEGVIKTEFENRCYDMEKNPSTYEERYIIANSNVQNEKIKIIHVSTPKTSIAQRKNYFSQYKVAAMLPMGITIPNIVSKEKKSTFLIVNIEKNTTITKVYNNAVSDVLIYQLGARNIIDKINEKENSYAKAYEICKNSTIYTENDKDLQYEENEYLVDIMPTLFQIVSEVRKVVDESTEKIEKIYITGTGAVIGNIDIYFQEYFRDVQCEILKPGFINSNSKINIKDYIEVNSAISLGVQGLEKNTGFNFIKESALNKTFNNLKTDVSIKNNNISFQGLDSFLSKYSRQYNVGTTTFVFITLIYFIGMFVINNQLQRKIELTDNSIQETNSRIKKVAEYTEKFNDQTTNYEALIRKIESINDSNSEDKRYRNTIPHLLNRIMVVIPKSVQLTSIENTTDTHIVIKATSNRSEQIAYFKTKLKVDGILENVVSDTGIMKGGNISVTIEGELP